MSGNVWEWCQSKYKPYPYNANDGREDLSSEDRRALRGGAWNYSGDDARVSNRSWYGPVGRYLSIGFRACLFPV